MEVRKDQIFNLWNTNGRRSDVPDALRIYLEILCEIREEYPGETWASYPASTAEFLFYRKAVERSPGVFKRHPQYDAFLERLGKDYGRFLSRDREWMAGGLSARDRAVLDGAIEARARHYTSNLVKIGFADKQRRISEAGFSYLKNRTERDPLESLLPIDNINLILFRQMMKLKVFSGPDEKGRRSYYSPFFMAVYLLLYQEKLEKTAFMTIVQGMTPYLTEEEKKRALSGGKELEREIWNVEIPVPQPFLESGPVSEAVFGAYIKNRKSSKVEAVYYEFYRLLRKLRQERSRESYGKLAELMAENRDKLQKAFGYGREIFDMGRGAGYTLEQFLEKNGNHPFLSSGEFNRRFYEAYFLSGRADDIREYSDTTERLLGASGLFRFSALPELSCGEVLVQIFDRELLSSRIFGAMDREEYEAYEEAEGCFFRADRSMAQILGFDGAQVRDRMEKIRLALGEETSLGIREKLHSRSSEAFRAHVESKYPREKIMELLPLFSDRKNDPRIQREVHDMASVPTIYEYVTGIAWYYLSGRDFDLYESLNLTLNADFEPVIHAGGGDGDIVIHYGEAVVMLEVTLMNKQAQRRGEWEPVLRHSLNLKAAAGGRETMTFFIADQLDYNTVNIWRAVAAASLESTNTHKKVDGVSIMPLTNGDILEFLRKRVPRERIMEEVRRSFAGVPRITDTRWREEILDNL